MILAFPGTDINTHSLYDGIQVEVLHVWRLVDEASRRPFDHRHQRRFGETMGGGVNRISEFLL